MSELILIVVPWHLTHNLHRILIHLFKVVFPFSELHNLLCFTRLVWLRRLKSLFKKEKVTELCFPNTQGTYWEHTHTHIGSQCTFLVDQCTLKLLLEFRQYKLKNDIICILCELMVVNI